MVVEYNKKGLVLVMVLWVVALLGVITAIAGRTSRLDTKVCLSGSERLNCKWASRAGIETAIGVLNDDLRASDSLNDLWSENEDDLEDIALAGCSFTVRVADEAGKLNINTATRKQLLELPEMTEEIADAIMDWRDSDDEPKQAGAEGGYYENLRFRYKIRNGPFRTIRELLLVKGVTVGLFYGEDTNFNGQLDYNERDGDKSRPLDDGDDELDKGWIEYLTCRSFDENKDAGGNKRVNINTSNQEELEGGLNIKKSHAKWIVDNRPKDKNKKQYSSIADLINEKSPKKSSEKDSDEAQALDLETFSNIVDKITVSNDARTSGKVNINTAPKKVLTALLGGGESAEKISDDIIDYREGLLTGMQSIGELLKIESVKVKTFKKIANHITTRSNVFTIRCVATADRGGLDGTILWTEVVVERSSEPCRILYCYQGANN